MKRRQGEINDDLPTGRENKRSIKATHKYLKSVGRDVEGYRKFWKKGGKCDGRSKEDSNT